MPELIYNSGFNTNNVFEITINKDKLMKLIEVHLSDLNRMKFYEQGKKELHIKNTSLPFFAKIPNWSGDISWVSAASKSTFNFFEQCYQSLEIEFKTQAVTGLEIPLIMYSGFFVVRSFATQTSYHHDYFNSGIQALTLITPIQLGNNNKTGHLLYKDNQQKECVYKYQIGKAILFGSDFLHSTQPFESQERCIFLSFTYGSTDLQAWKEIKKTAANQGIAYRHPDGKIRVTNSDFIKYF